MVNLIVRFNAQVVREKLKIAAKLSGNARSFWEVVGGKAYKQIMKNFEDERGSEGKWPALKEDRSHGRDVAAAAKRVKAGKITRGPKMLQDTGTLRASIRYRVGSFFVELFSNLKYARVHQYGDDSKNILQREYLWVPKNFVQDTADNLKAFMLGRK